jgi:hypothetical protein
VSINEATIQTSVIMRIVPESYQKNTAGGEKVAAAYQEGIDTQGVRSLGASSDAALPDSSQPLENRHIPAKYQRAGDFSNLKSGQPPAHMGRERSRVDFAEESPFVP